MNWRTRQTDRLIAASLADVLAAQWDDAVRRRAVDDARKHLASMSPERRAQLEAEWQ